MTMAAKRLRDRSDYDIMRGVDEVDTCGTSITLGLFRLLTGQKIAPTVLNLLLVHGKRAERMTKNTLN